MGRTSKFSFPIPGRRHAADKEQEMERERQRQMDRVQVSSPSTTSSASLSKAQRFFGTDSDLNIDSPTRDDDIFFKYPSSRSSAMSISISESTFSTKSTNETGSINGSDKWDHESGVLPKEHFNGKASSTLLGQRYRDDGVTDTSSRSERLRNEGSSSTLKSFYDRQKSPLAISQQTSESSSRDLALRKGMPPVISRSPLLQVESVDVFDQHFGGITTTNMQGDSRPDLLNDKISRKKPVRMDLSMLFPGSRGRKTSDTQSSSPSSIVTNDSLGRSNQPHQSARKRLTKALSREALRSEKQNVIPEQLAERKQRQTNGTLHSLYDHYAQMSSRSPMDQIPEFGDTNSSITSVNTPDLPLLQPVAMPVMDRKREPQPNFQDREPSWKNIGASMTSAAWEGSSTTSNSSLHTKTSRHTNNSAISTSDLKQKSVLSLSSDSESDEGNEPVKILKSSNKAERLLNGAPEKSQTSRRQSAQPHLTATSRTQGPRKSTQGGPYLKLPKTSASGSRLSGPWATAQTGLNIVQNPRLSVQQINPRHSSRTKSQPSRDPSVAFARSSQQPTPPLSPTSVVFREVPDQGGRFMAVTKQEEALLEALRQKRARMRETIIKEHETGKSPSPPPTGDKSASRMSKASTVSTIREGPKGKQQILLCLDTPLSESQRIDTAEPSPDLSDFLSFGSDEDSTPRTSWAAPRRGRPRPDSAVSPAFPADDLPPVTPPAAARLSAVGAVHGFKDERERAGSKKRLTGVRFVDDLKVGDPEELLFDEDENGAVWGL